MLWRFSLVSRAETTLWTKSAYETYDLIVAGSLTGDLSDCSTEIKSLIAGASSVMIFAPHLHQLKASHTVRADCTVVPLPSDLKRIWEVMDSLPRARVVVASGDPGFFGVVRILREQRPDAKLLTLPGPSSIARAFGRIGRSWDDATVISAHGRGRAEIDAAWKVLRDRQSDEHHGSFAVLTSPEHPPESIVFDFTAAGVHVDRLVVASDLESESEVVLEGTPESVAEGRYSPRSIVIGLWGSEHPRRSMTPTPTRPTRSSYSVFNDEGFRLADGNYTKAPVRAAIVRHLTLDRLPYGSTVYDLGAGYGTVGTTLLGLRPDLRLIFIERDPTKLETIATNLAAFDLGAELVTSDIITYLKQHPDPPGAIFLGGGGESALRYVCTSFAHTTRICATFASLERAQLAHELLGNVEIISDRRLRRFKGGSRMTESHSTFVAWNHS
jgi:precorrin-6Y C5,15-methyltransferase (decarboxylating)